VAMVAMVEAGNGRMSNLTFERFEPAQLAGL
jgi:hypothetical protein